MVLPFKDNSHGLGLRHMVKPVATYLTSTLKGLLRNSHSKGGYKNSWMALQMELALEELFFGRLFYPPSRPFAISLGTLSTDPNSLTKRRGFLGLSPVGSASVGESPPLIKIWISDTIQRLRIERIFPFTDTLEAGPAVIGEALVRVILSDLHDINEGISIQSLKGDAPPLLSKLVGCRTVEQLCRNLSERKGFDYPRTFGRALEMARAAGHDVYSCLESGTSELKFFPAFTSTEAPSTAAEAAALLGDVCAEIEKRGLCYSSNLQRYKGNGIPWMEPVIKQLPKNPERVKKINTLTLVSCAGLIQNGDFVSFACLRSLLQDVTLSQSQLQKLNIMSPLILVHSPTLNRLHQSFPHKLAPRQPEKPKATTSKAPSKRAPSPQLSEQEDQEEEEMEQVIERVKTKTVPANFKTKWSDEELQLVMANPGLSHAQAYQAYVKACEELGRPARTIRAFRSKRQRLS